MPHGGEFWALSCPACRERCAVDHARMVCCTYLCEVGHGADPDRGTASQHSNIVSHTNHVVGPMQPGTQTLSAFVIARLDEALARRVALGRRLSCPPGGWGLGPDQGTCNQAQVACTQSHPSVCRSRYLRFLVIRRAAVVAEPSVHQCLCVRSGKEVLNFGLTPFGVPWTLSS